MTNDPSNPEYNAKARDAIMDLCPFYDPNHKCGIVREHVFKDCLTELRERNRQTEAERDGWKRDCLRNQWQREEWKQRVKELEATMATLKEQLKADEKAAYDLRCIVHEVAEYCGISTSLWPAAIAERLRQMKDDKDEIENMWEELTMAIGAQGPESDPLTGCDTNDEIHKRAIDQIKTMMSDEF